MKTESLARFLEKRPFSGALLLLGLLLIAFWPLGSAGFISWDDPEYVLENADVQQFALGRFFSSFYVGNYQPLTLLSYALDWKLFGNNPLGFHAMNLALHAINTLLVYVLARRVVRHALWALLVAAVFCVHPLQVESVAWIAERKNLLYTLFFLGALLHYVHYLEQPSSGKYFRVLFLFVLSLLSKPAALAFPLALIAMDLMLERKFHTRAWLEKIPFFLLSLLFGWIALKAQSARGFLNESHTVFDPWHKVIYAGNALWLYLWKWLLPLKLSAFYPYPPFDSLRMVVGIMLVCGALALCLWLWRRKQYVLLGALLFFGSNIFLVLQWVAFGEALAADRYMYLSMLGLLFFMAFLFRRSKVQILPWLGALFLVLYTSLSYGRSRIWKNSMTLYYDAVNKSPHAFVALNSLGVEYLIQGNTAKAHHYLEEAIRVSPAYFKVYYNNGLAYVREGRWEEAIQNFNRSLALKPYYKAYIARANARLSTQRYAEAIADAEQALQTDPLNVKALFVKANAEEALQRFPEALADYGTLLRLQPNEALFYLRHAIVQGQQQNFAASIHDLDRCLQLQPRLGEAYYWRGIARYNLHLDPCQDLHTAASLDFAQAQAASMRYCSGR